MIQKMLLVVCATLFSNFCYCIRADFGSFPIFLCINGRPDSSVGVVIR